MEQAQQSEKDKKPAAAAAPYTLVRRRRIKRLIPRIQHGYRLFFLRHIRQSGENRFDGARKPHPPPGCRGNGGAQYVLSGGITSPEDRKLLIIGILRIDDPRQTAGDALTYGSIEEIQGGSPL
ncbi:MAG: hypothetical protein LBB83_09335 [Treponema sp.]|nr:hypothetical protein [Treponema sp.]